MLLVDAYESSRRALADLLRESGYTVREARDAVEGLLSLGERLPQLIILDPFPDVAGSRKLLRELRQTHGGRSVPCVLLTSTGGAQLEERAFAEECVAVLEKPCAPGEVLALIHRLLGPALAAQSVGPAARGSWRRN